MWLLFIIVIKNQLIDWLIDFQEEILWAVKKKNEIQSWDCEPKI